MRRTGNKVFKNAKSEGGGVGGEEVGGHSRSSTVCQFIVEGRDGGCELMGRLLSEAIISWWRE